MPQLNRGLFEHYDTSCDRDTPCCDANRTIGIGRNFMSTSSVAR